MSFGGGLLGRYGINSNTSGVGFLKSTYKKNNKDKAKSKKPIDGRNLKVPVLDKKKT